MSTMLMHVFQKIDNETSKVAYHLEKFSMHKSLAEY